MKIWLRLALAIFLIGGLIWLAWPRPAAPTSVQLAGLAVAPVTGFTRANGVRHFEFPLDFGPHPDYQTEWWYYTGNLVTPTGRHFGYQLTFFRRALLPAQDQAPRASAWAANQIYLAHFTLSDSNSGQFQYFERFERGAAGLAGASGSPRYQVWLGDWSVEQTGDSSYQLTARQDRIHLNLDLSDRKGPALQGIDGYSQKGADPANASYYVSQTHLVSRGTLELDGQSFALEGSSWMDHEFSTSALAPDQVGWDWFALQLSDDSELMVYTVRAADGTVSPYSQGTLIRPDGSTRHLSLADFKISVLSTWQSPHSGAVYPGGWRVEVPSEQIVLQVQPRMPDQELRVSFIYWEGAVTITGTHTSHAITGSGYVELTGYAASMQGQF
jgi:predicted secreted hydrolase